MAGDARGLGQGGAAGLLLQGARQDHAPQAALRRRPGCRALHRSHLGAFLALLPDEGRFAFEFRHPSWFEPDALEALRKKRAALCFNDADVEGCPLVETASWGVLKLRRVEYSSSELAAIARQVRAKSWSEAFVFFKHEETASGPRLARTLRGLLERPAGPRRLGRERGSRRPARAGGRKVNKVNARPGTEAF